MYTLLYTATLALGLDEVATAGQGHGGITYGPRSVCDGV